MDGSSPDAYPELAYRVKGAQLSYLQDTRDTPKAQLKGIGPVKWNGRMDDPGQEGDGPILGEGVGQGGIKAPPLHAQAGIRPPPLALHNPILLMNCSTAPWRIFIYGLDLGNLGAGHSNMMPP